MITYKHEPYIAQAIEGVLMQETDFPVELVIGEDCSTDNTRKICEDYARRFPDKIRLLARERNLGMCENFLQTIRACNGEYVAFCEGDDYWIKKQKLSEQVEFLAANPHYSGACSSVYLQQSDSKHLRPQLLHRELENEEDVTLVRLLENFTLHTATFMCRRSALSLNVFAKGAPAMDIGVFLVCLDVGNVRFFNSPDVVYRGHTGGVTYKREFFRFYEMVLIFLDYFDEITDFKYLEHTANKRRRLKFYSAINSPESSTASKLLRLVRYCFVNRREISVLEAKNILGLAFPWAVSAISKFRRRGLDETIVTT